MKKFHEREMDWLAHEVVNWGDYMKAALSLRLEWNAV